LVRAVGRWAGFSARAMLRDSNRAAVEHIAIEEQQRRNSGLRQRRARELPKRLRFQAGPRRLDSAYRGKTFDPVDIAFLSAPGVGELRRAPGRAVFSDENGWTVKVLSRPCPDYNYTETTRIGLTRCTDLFMLTGVGLKWQEISSV
jgi:hypothetical protein